MLNTDQIRIINLAAVDYAVANYKDVPRQSNIVAAAEMLADNRRYFHVDLYGTIIPRFQQKANDVIRYLRQSANLPCENLPQPVRDDNLDDQGRCRTCGGFEGHAIGFPCA